VHKNCIAINHAGQDSLNSDWRSHGVKMRIKPNV